MRPLWPMVLYALLVAAAALALYAQRAPVSPTLARVAPWLFLAFAVGFAGYRFALVSARRYSPFKAFFQVLMAALFFMLLVWPRPQTPVAGLQASPLAGAMASPDVTTRALAAEVAGYRADVSAAPRLLQLLSDADATVRQAAHASLVRLNGGEDLGPDAAAWRERFP